MQGSADAAGGAVRTNDSCSVKMNVRFSVARSNSRAVALGLRLRCGKMALRVMERAPLHARSEQFPDTSLRDEGFPEFSRTSRLEMKGFQSLF